MNDPDAAEVELEFPQANVVAVNAIAGALASTLGPGTMDKLLVTQLADNETQNPTSSSIDDVVVANDGATILDHLPLEHPVAPIVRRIVGPERPGTTGVEGQDVADGITTTAVLAAALLDEATRLLDLGVHQADILRGYHAGLDIALETIDEMTVRLDVVDDRDATELAVARSAMTGNDVGGIGESAARMAVEAVDHVGAPTERTLAVRRLESGSMSDSRLVRGAVLDRNDVVHERMPTRIEDASVLVIGGYRRGKASDGRSGGLLDPVVQRDGERLSIESPADVEAFDDVFAARRDAVVSGLISAGVDVVVTRLGISSEYAALLADHGIMGVRGVNRLKLAQVARATGASLVMDPTDVEPSALGTAGVVEQWAVEPRRNGRARRRMVVFDECPEPAAVTVVLRGVFGQLADQATTEVRKAVLAVAAARGAGSHRPGVVPGAGAVEVQVALAVREAATREDSRAQLALSGFADAVERPVFALAKNAGDDPLSVLADLRAAADRGEGAAGFVLPERIVTDAAAAEVLDSAAIRRACYVAAVEVAGLILRVDDALDATFERESTDPDDVIYDERAEMRQDHLENREQARSD